MLSILKPGTLIHGCRLKPPGVCPILGYSPPGINAGIKAGKVEYKVHALTLQYLTGLCVMFLPLGLCFSTDCDEIFMIRKPDGLI